MRTLNALLAALLVACLAALPGCCCHPPHPPAHAHIQHIQRVPRCQRQFGEIMHPLVDPNGCQYLMGDSQFRNWQAPAPAQPAAAQTPPAE